MIDKCSLARLIQNSKKIYHNNLSIHFPTPKFTTRKFHACKNSNSQTESERERLPVDGSTTRLVEKCGHPAETGKGIGLRESGRGIGDDADV